MRALILLLAAGDGFGRGPVDFWGAARRNATAARGPWADPSAPEPVRRLLAAPSEENARAYVAWQRERLRRLREALAAVEAVSRSSGILYFSRPGCPWCVAQDRELEGLEVTRVPAGSPLWKEHGVTVTPTLVVGAKVLRGFTPRRAIERVLGDD